MVDSIDKNVESIFDSKLNKTYTEHFEHDLPG